MNVSNYLLFIIQLLEIRATIDDALGYWGWKQHNQSYLIGVI